MAQPSQTVSARVLCVSPNVLLRNTRRMVLSLRYEAVAVGTVQEMHAQAGKAF